jgi:predicted nucleic acid-binding protein
MVEFENFRRFEVPARQRISCRDEDDWPVLAAALALECPIWTEDTDFFGCGVATWTTDRVELYLAEAAS